MIELLTARQFHMIGVLLVFGFLVVKGRRPVKLWSIFGLAIGCLFIGVAYNLILGARSIVRELTFDHTNYGSYFVILGYALLMYFGFGAIERVFRGSETKAEDVSE